MVRSRTVDDAARRPQAVLDMSADILMSEGPPSIQIFDVETRDDSNVGDAERGDVVIVDRSMTRC